MERFSRADEQKGRRKHADTPLFWAFLALLVWVPLPMASNRAWSWGIMEIWVFILFSFWLILHLRGRLVIPPVVRDAWPALALIGFWLFYQALYLVPLPAEVVGFISPKAYEAYTLVKEFGDISYMHLSVDVHASYQMWVKSLTYGLIFLLTLLLVRSERRLRLLVYTLMLSGLFQAGFGAAMVLSGREYAFFYEKEYMRGVATGTFVARTHLAAYLNLCLGLGIGLLVAIQDDKALVSWKARFRALINWIVGEQMRIRIILTVMVIGLVMTHSRMGNAAFFASLLIVGVIALISSRHASKSTIRLIVSLIIIDILVVGSWFGLSEVVERIEKTNLETSDRAEYSEASLGLIADYPLMGSGPGTYFATLMPYKVRIYLGGYIDHAHNDYLEFTAENGLLGIIQLGAMVILAFIVSLRAHYRRYNPLMRGLSFGVMLSILALMIQATVDFALQIPAIALTFMVILALPWIIALLNQRGSDVDEDEPLTSSRVF